MRRFSHFAVADWSGAKGARQKGIAIAICEAGKAAPQLVRPNHVWSREEVLHWLIDELPENTLVGFDLSPGLPFDDAGAFFPGWAESPADARALWALVDRLSAEDPHFAVSSFVAHPEARHYFRNGRVTGARFGADGGGRLRRVEKGQRDAYRLQPSSCLNLVGPSQVGKSCLTAMRLLHRLDGRLPFWPFDPLPEAGSVLLEIYTSLAARDAGIPRGRSKMRDAAGLNAALHALDCEEVVLDRYDDHATDAILTAVWLRANAARPELWQPTGLTSEIARTEGWTFGIA